MSESPVGSLLQRTDELRSRLIWSFAVIVAIAVAAYIFRTEVLDFLRRPLAQDKLIFIHPTEAFFTYIKISLFVGVLVSAPFLLYQIIAFLSPLLKSREKFTTTYFAFTFLFGTVFFYFGAGFALLGVMPFAIDFLKGISGENLEAVFTIGNYSSFVMSFTLIFGFVFELPIVVYALASAGMITKRTLISQWRIIIAGAAAVAAVLTPPDPITQMFLWGPLLVLYGLSIILAAIAERSNR